MTRTISKNHWGGIGQRVAYIDALKGFAILCVVLGHIVDGYMASNFFLADRELLNGIYNVVYAFHMPLFMMLSGYVYGMVYIGQDGMPRKGKIYIQVGNLLTVYLLYSVVLVVFHAFFGRFTNTDIPWKSLLWIWMRPISIYWYLYVLALMYLTFTFICYRGVNWRIVLPVSFFLSLFGWTGNKFIDLSSFEIDKVLYYSVFFYLGHLYKRNDSKAVIRLGSSFRWKITTLLFGMSFMLCILFWNDELTGINSLNHVPVVNSLIALGISCTIWSLFECVKILNNGLLQCIGRHSLEIYVLHCIFTAGFRTIFRWMGIGNVYICIFLNLFLSVAIVILLAEISKMAGLHGLFFKPVTYVIERLKKGTSV